MIRKTIIAILLLGIMTTQGCLRHCNSGVVIRKFTHVVGHSVYYEVILQDTEGECEMLTDIEGYIKYHPGDTIR